MAKIFFSKEQFEALAVMAYLGDWMINANEVSDSDKYDKRSASLLSYLSTFAKEHGLESWTHKSDSGLDRSNDFCDANYQIIKEYDEEVMYDELSERLARRDFERLYNRAPIFTFDEHDDYLLFSELKAKWAEEFEEYGVENLITSNKKLTK